MTQYARGRDAIRESVGEWGRLHRARQLATPGSRARHTGQESATRRGLGGADQAGGEGVAVGGVDDEEAAGVPVAGVGVHRQWLGQPDTRAADLIKG